MEMKMKEISAKPRKTPLYDAHVRRGAKMEAFGGYLLPMQFQSGIRREHMAVREACGLFDVSHMPEFLCRGPRALDALNYLFTRDYSDLRTGSIRYGMMCREDGGILDDLFVHRLEQDTWMITMNTATRERDFQWIREHTANMDGVEWKDISDETATLDLQGPEAENALRQLTEAENIPEGRFQFKSNATVGGCPALIARTGFTGEDGFEIYTRAEDAEKLWELFLDECRFTHGMYACGLGSRDTLRIEAGLPLYGREMNESLTPLDAGFDYGIEPDKKTEYIGRDALLRQREAGGSSVRLVGLRVTGRGIIREGHVLYRGERAVGTVTSGTFCAGLNAALAMAYVQPECAAPGTALEADVRGRRVKAVVEELPFYRREK